jgi:predicted Zn-dependent protease
MVVVARAKARKAQELLPSKLIAHALLGIIAASYDYDWKEAEEQFGLARASEPLPPYVHDMRPHKALDLDDRIYVANWVIDLSYFFQGKRVDAQEPAEQALRLAPWSVATAGALAGLLARAGEKDRAEKLLARILGADSVGLYMYHLICSEIDDAVDCYAQGIEQRSPRAMVPVHAGPSWRE